MTFRIASFCPDHECGESIKPPHICLTWSRANLLRLRIRSGSDSGHGLQSSKHERQCHIIQQKIGHKHHPRFPKRLFSSESIYCTLTTLHQPFYPQTTLQFPQPATPSLPFCPSLGGLVFATSSCLMVSSNDGGFSYGGGAATSTGNGAARGVKVNSSSVITLSVRSRLTPLLRLTILAYSTEARKSRRMVPTLMPTMSAVCL